MTFSDDGTMIFASNRKDKFATNASDPMDLYLLAPGSETPVSIAALNSPFDDREPHLSPDGQSILFTSNRAAGAPGSPNGMFISHKGADGEWQPPKLISGLDTYPKDHCPMFLRSRPKTLCYASFRPGGYGGSDIWCAELRADGSFSPPINAGPHVNGKGNEWHYNEDRDGWVYFTSSTRRPGAQGKLMELWMTRVADDQGRGSLPPVNLGANVNAGFGALCPAHAPDGKLVFFAMAPGRATDIFVSQRQSRVGA
jgi:hypothetical protein